MKIIRARVLGFCMGVRRAVTMAEEMLDKCADMQTPVYTMGPLIHNPSVLKKLTDRGLHTLEEKDIPGLPDGSTVVIRAHGIPPVLQQALTAKGAQIADATCPRVKVNQKRAAEFSEKGYTVILTGDKGHGEVSSIAGYAKNKLVLLQNEPEAEEYVRQLTDCTIRAVLLSQTTFDPAVFERISGLLKAHMPNLEVHNTICTATQERQTALDELIRSCDGILVIGGRMSANTRRLYHTAAVSCPHAAHIESAQEIPEEFFSLNVVGITAGASTPDDIIDAVERRLRDGAAGCR